MKHKPLAPLFIHEKHPTNPQHSVNKVSNRKTRFDKVAPMQFPVTPEENKRFRRLFLEYKDKLQADSITHFRTMLVRFGLRHPEMLSRSLDYKNTTSHKPVKPNQIEKSLLVDLSIDWDTSERRALHGVIFSVMNYLDKGGELTYEKVQPFRPSE